MKTMDEGPQRTDIVVQGKRRVMRRRLSEFSERAHRAAKLKGNVSILLAGSQEIRALNLRYRRKNKATDVLSFPSPQELRAHSAGDLAISVDIAAQNARELRHSLTEELAILILHGMLSLLLFAGAFLLDLDALRRQKLAVTLLSIVRPGQVSSR